MKTSSSIRLVFRFGLQQSPGARYSHCRSQSALGISQLRARPLRSHHQHHLLPRHHQHHLPPSLSLYRAQPVAITRPLRKPASGPTSIRYNLHLRPIRASAKSFCEVAYTYAHSAGTHPQEPSHVQSVPVGNSAFHLRDWPRILHRSFWNQSQAGYWTSHAFGPDRHPELSSPRRCVLLQSTLVYRELSPTSESCDTRCDRPLGGRVLPWTSSIWLLQLNEENC